MTRAGWLGVQGVGEAIERFAAMVETLQRRCELAGDEQGRREKQRMRKEERRRLQSFIGRPRKQGEATTESFPRQREAKAATRAPGTPKMVAGHVARAVNTVHRIYKIAIQFETQITPKFL